MSNGGLAASLKDIGIASMETAVGDRFVFEAMQKGDLTLGGEQSGHIIIRKYATSGDELLTAIMLCEEMCDRKLSLSELCKGLRIYPQITKNLKVRDQNAVMTDEAVNRALREVEEALGDSGRVILRKSGTEPVVRIMVECENEVLCSEYAERIARAIEDRGHIAL
jgi:phosphoglucosamine mutase